MHLALITFPDMGSLAFVLWTGRSEIVRSDLTYSIWGQILDTVVLTIRLAVAQWNVDGSSSGNRSEEALPQTNAGKESWQAHCLSTDIVYVNRLGSVRLCLHMHIDPTKTPNSY